MNPNDTSDTETHEPPADRFCDLVMKGGITSGVVYPRAIRRLSEHYRFRGIGGTSAGAIAAAITAAAEYQRRENNGSREGFNLLGSLPEELGSEIKKGKYKLLSLFQPQPATRRLFAVLVRTLNKSSTKNRWFSLFQGLLIAYWPATVLSMIVGFGSCSKRGMAGCILAAGYSTATQHRLLGLLGHYRESGRQWIRIMQRDVRGEKYRGPDTLAAQQDSKGSRARCQG